MASRRLPIPCRYIFWLFLCPSAGGNCLPKIVHKVLSFAESSERLQARMPATRTTKYIAIRQLALLRGGRPCVGCKLHADLQIATRSLSPAQHVKKKGWVSVREKTFMYFVTSIIPRCFEDSSVSPRRGHCTPAESPAV